MFKRRLSGDATEVTALAADVRNKTVVIYDDMIRTGGSLLGAAKAFKDAGATRIAASIATCVTQESRSAAFCARQAPIAEAIASAANHDAVERHGDSILRARWGQCKDRSRARTPVRC